MSAGTIYRGRLLCIEDDRETADLIVEELVERGYQVRVCYNGPEGYSAIIDEHPDLVLTDITMPLLSGFDILDRLAAAGPHFSKMPVVFVTAFSSRDTEIKARRLGVDDFVTKPIDFDMLDTIIMARLAGTARSDFFAQSVHMSDREVEALTWAARGKTSAEIAIILGLSKRTIDFHIENARVKLGAATRIEAAIKAATSRIIRP